MTERDLLRCAWSNLGIQRLRSLLTVLAVAIAVAAIVGVAAILDLSIRTVMKEFERVGSTHLAIVPWQRPEAAIGSGPVTLTRGDGKAIEQIEGVVGVSPLLRGESSVTFGGRSYRPSLVGGVRDDWLEMETAEISEGRFIATLDLERHRPVAVVGATVVEELGLMPDPVGRRITVAGTPMEIVGTLEPQGRSLLGGDSDDVVFIPFETALGLFGHEAGKRLQLRIRCREPEQVRKIEQEISRLLRQRHGLGSDHGNDFQILVPDRILSTSRSVLRSLGAGAFAVLALALLVGGIGIMNIMLVSVTERTREIGLRKSLGASRLDIFRQFLVEALLLSWLGGFLGIVFGALFASMLALLLSWVLPDGSPGLRIPSWTILLASSFCTLVGLFFGLYPAQRAAALEPVEALRHS